MADFYKKWLSQETWTIEQAAFLFYGQDPEQWDGMVPKENDSANIYLIDDFGLDNFRTMIHDLRWFIREAFNKSGNFDRIEVVRMCQWAYVVQNNFWIDDSFAAYLHSLKDKMEAGYDWFDLDFQKLAKKDLWTQVEILNAITFCPTQLGDWHDQYDSCAGSVVIGAYPESFRTLYPKSEQREGVKELFNLSKNAAVFTTVLLDGQSLYKPSQLIEWAQEKNFRLPPKLLEYMGLSDQPESSNKSPTRRTSQIHKQLCQAVARTLWDIYPKMTIEEMKTHHAIQEYAQGKIYGGKDTLRGWLREVDPRPPEEKRGAPRKKKIPV